MWIKFSCGCCGRRLRVAEVEVGKRATCPGCLSVVVIPGPSTAEESPRSTTEFEIPTAWKHILDSLADDRRAPGR